MDYRCRACGAGTYSDAVGAVSCSLCPNGTASAALRAVSNATCAPCVRNSFALHAGATVGSNPHLELFDDSRRVQPTP